MNFLMLSIRSMVDIDLLFFRLEAGKQSLLKAMPSFNSIKLASK